MPLLDVHKLTVLHRERSGFASRSTFAAVDDVSFALDDGERLGLVGESGCGKSTLCFTLLGLFPAAAGTVMWDGLPLTGPQAVRRRQVSGMQMVFQDPGGSLNPRMRVGSQLREALLLNRGAAAADRQRQAVQLLGKVGLNAGAMERHPHVFSGGQRQRIGLARALAASPRLLIADEPVSALDVCVQAQVLEVMLNLQREQKFALLFVAHDLAVVRMMCTRTLVMYQGRLVEQGPVDELFARPLHPYTQALLNAVPDIDRALRRRAGAAPALPRPENRATGQRLAGGCVYRDRCPAVLPECKEQRPSWREAAPGHGAACHQVARIRLPSSSVIP